MQRQLLISNDISSAFVLMRFLLSYWRVYHITLFTPYITLAANKFLRGNIVENRALGVRNKQICRKVDLPTATITERSLCFSRQVVCDSSVFCVYFMKLHLYSRSWSDPCWFPTKITINRAIISVCLRTDNKKLFSLMSKSTNW